MAMPHINKKHRTCDMMMAGNLISWLQYAEKTPQSQIIDHGQRLVIQDNLSVASGCKGCLRTHFLSPGQHLQQSQLSFSVPQVNSL